jgi:hypothetical protein
MKNLIEMIFKREPTLNYVIAEYQPSGDFVAKSFSKPNASGENELEIKDEMQIDNLYQKN